MPHRSIYLEYLDNRKLAGGFLADTSYFIDVDKEIDRVHAIEHRLRSWATIRGLEIALVPGLALLFTVNRPPEEGQEFLFASVCGLLVFLLVELLGQILDSAEEAQKATTQGGLARFSTSKCWMLDASFSFDGIIGAFALTQNLFLIAIGLGIGAFYVRSMTIMLVQKETLAEFRYLEHGVFYSILSLSFIMFANSIWHVPEVITGLLGAGLIGLALWSSLRHNKLALET